MVSTSTSTRNVDSLDESHCLSIVCPTSPLSSSSSSSSVRLSLNPSNTSSNLSGSTDCPLADQSRTEAVGCFPRHVQPSLTMIVVDPLDLSSLNSLQSEEQRRVDHRRNPSEPFASNEEQQILVNPSTKKKSPVPAAVNAKTTVKKKSSWFNPFQSSYRQRNEEFKKLFKDLPPDERLIVDYSCAWQKEILIQGRMYLSVDCLCFHANFLKWETSLILHWKDLSHLTREKTAKVIPNAIELKSNKGEKYFFASFATRDKTFAIAKRLWERNRQDQPFSSTEIWKLIEESYGNDLDRTTDDEEEKKDPLPPLQQVEASPSNKSNRSSVNSSQSRYERFRDQSSLSSRNDDDDEDLDDDDDDDHGEKEQRQQRLTMEEERKSRRRSRTARSELEYLFSCPCESSSHLATQLIDRNYPMNVEHLFDCVFGDNPFLQAYRASRRVKDFHADPWQINPSTGKRERLCTYKVSVAGVFGATTICSTEKQIIDCESSGSHYLIDTQVRNEGIKYADAFFVATRYCLVQIGEKRAHFKVTSEVRYVKSLMIIIKSFIEKNATAALQDSYTDMMKRLEQESSSRMKTSIDHSKEKTKKKLTKKSTSIEEHSKEQIEEQKTTNVESLQTISLPDPRSSSSSWTGNQFFLLFSFLTMFLLLSVNLFLYMKLNEIDRMTDRLVQSYPHWSKKSSYSTEDDQWAILLQRQEEYYQAKLGGLRSILISTYSALKNVTETLNELSKSSTESTSSNVYSF